MISYGFVLCMFVIIAGTLTGAGEYGKRSGAWFWFLFFLAILAMSLRHTYIF